MGTSSQVRGILSEADQVFRCLKKSLSLSPTNTTTCIESANFAFTMSAFCSRQQRLFRTGTTTTTNQEGSEEQISESVLSDEKSVSSELKEIGPMYPRGASDHYAKALELMAKQDEDEAVDEMWLLH